MRRRGTWSGAKRYSVFRGAWCIIRSLGAHARECVCVLFRLVFFFLTLHEHSASFHLFPSDPLAIDSRVRHLTPLQQIAQREMDTISAKNSSSWLFVTSLDFLRFCLVSRFLTLFYKCVSFLSAHKRCINQLICVILEYAEFLHLCISF